MFNCIQAKWSEKKPLELKYSSNDTVDTLGILEATVKLYHWRIHRANIAVGPDGFRPILGHDLFDQLGITITQKPCPHVQISNIGPPCTIKQTITKEFPGPITRTGKSKHHTVNSNFPKNYHVTHQNGQNIPIRLQPKIKIEL